MRRLLGGLAIVVLAACWRAPALAARQAAARRGAGDRRSPTTPARCRSSRTRATTPRRWTICSGELGFEVTAVLDGDRDELDARRSRDSSRLRPRMPMWRWSIIPATASRRAARTISCRPTPTSRRPTKAGADAGAGVGAARRAGEDRAGHDRAARCVPVDAFPAGHDDPAAGRRRAGRGAGDGARASCADRRRSRKPGVPADSLGMVIGFAASPGPAGARWRAGRAEFALCGGAAEASRAPAAIRSAT